MLTTLMFGYFRAAELAKSGALSKVNIIKDSSLDSC